MKGRQVSGVDASLVFPSARLYKASACKRRFHFQVTSGTEEEGTSGGSTDPRVGAVSVDGILISAVDCECYLIQEITQKQGSRRHRPLRASPPAPVALGFVPGRVVSHMYDAPRSGFSPRFCCWVLH